MNGRVMLDANVLVYAEDTSEPAKRQIAQDVIAQLIAHDQAVVTSQVLGEYFYTVTRRFPTRLGPEAASARLDVLVELLGVFDTSATVVLEAARGVVRYRMHYYDAQIWAAARLNGIGLVLSEDFQDGQEIEGVRFADPFAEGFDLGSVLEGV